MPFADNNNVNQYIVTSGYELMNFYVRVHQNTAAEFVLRVLRQSETALHLQF